MSQQNIQQRPLIWISVPNGPSSSTRVHEIGVFCEIHGRTSVTPSSRSSRRAAEPLRRPESVVVTPPPDLPGRVSSWRAGAGICYGMQDMAPSWAQGAAGHPSGFGVEVMSLTGPSISARRHQ